MRFLLLFSASLVLLGQTDSAIEREGAYWRQTTAGAIPAAERIRVSAVGPVVVEGQPGRRGISYVLRKRVRAASHADAARLLQEIGLVSKARSGWLYVSFALPERGVAAPELTLHVPRSLRECSVETPGGDLSGFGMDGSVELKTGGGHIELDRIGGHVEARTAGGEIRLGNVNGTARCVSGGGSIRVDSLGGESWLETAGGEIIVRQVGGPLRASTAGNIHVERAASTVTAHALGGVIEVGHAGGLVTAETSGGSINVSSVRGVLCESAAGAIKLRRVSGALRATTATGSIWADLIGGRPLEDSFLNTGAGDVTVFIPSNLAVTVKAQNDFAARRNWIVSEFPEIQVRSAGISDPLPWIVEGALNGGGPLLKISASGGTIYLKRQK